LLGNLTRSGFLSASAKECNAPDWPLATGAPAIGSLANVTE